MHVYIMAVMKSSLLPGMISGRLLDRVYKGGKSRYEAKLIIHCLGSKATFCPSGLIRCKPLSLSVSLSIVHVCLMKPKRYNLIVQGQGLIDKIPSKVLWDS